MFSVNGDNRKKKCIHCCSDIPKDANLCSVCKFHQNKWRDAATFFASAAGLIALIFSGIAFGFANIKSLASDYNWRDGVDIIKFSEQVRAGRDITLINSGDGAIYVDSIVIIGEGLSMSLGVQAMIEPGATNRTEAFSFDRSGASYVSSDDGTITAELRKFLERSYTTNGSLCYISDFRNVGNIDVDMVRGRYEGQGKKLASADAKATIRYFSKKKRKWMKSDHNLVEVVLKMPSKECDDNK